MRVGKHFILAAAVVAVTMLGPSDASAWGYSRHGYGSYFGLGRHYGYGRQYGYGRHHGYGRRYGYGRGYYSGRGYAAPPASSQPAQPAPANPTANQSSNCRAFTTTIIIKGEEQTVSGTACRQNDGRWKIVN